MNGQFSLDFGNSFVPKSPRIEYRDVIVDRKSHYSVTVLYVESYDEVKKYFQELKKEPYFHKATHNSYAYRVKQVNGSILEGKNDDGEQGAGMCILRELQRENAVNTLLIVTRYFGGIQLHTDRFKHVIDATKIFFERKGKEREGLGGVTHMYLIIKNTMLRLEIPNEDHKAMWEHIDEGRYQGMYIRHWIQL